MTGNNRGITNYTSNLHFLTPQTAACMTASKPHSGISRFAETRCCATISLNLSVLLVRGKTCLYPNVGRHDKPTLL